MTKEYDTDPTVTDLGQAKVQVHGTLGTVKAGSRMCKVGEGVVVAHPDDAPYLIRWDGSREELKCSSDGAIIMPPVAGLDSMTINFSISSAFESIGLDRGWLTREQQLIEDLRDVVKPSAINDVSIERTGYLVTLCRRALNVLEDLT